jgi:hypothetical protein
MRTLMKITVPVTTGNKALGDGTLPRVVQATLETIKPEAAFFSVAGGKRTAWMFFDLQDVTQMPAVCEPLFSGLDAEIELVPVMNAQELQAGLGAMARR